MPSEMVFGHFSKPDPGIRFFALLSGFLKTSFLKLTQLNNFPGAKIFPDKKSPASGFCLKLNPKVIFHK